ncbi:hypothetical protein [Halorubrum ezzemoulense]|uniref:hypothetical protein n=1 Tax=Halorubrum ezzemoulense TaxID=337243 RepID=UPI00232D3610|nr:hypothetical protein [Halorubrum ezzemoulense]
MDVVEFALFVDRIAVKIPPVAVFLEFSTLVPEEEEVVFVGEIWISVNGVFQPQCEAVEVRL